MNGDSVIKIVKVKKGSSQSSQKRASRENIRLDPEKNPNRNRISRGQIKLDGTQNLSLEKEKALVSTLVRRS